jgi:hypothetical protein
MTEECDSEIFERILSKVIGDEFQTEYRMHNLTFVGIKNSNVQIMLNDGKLQEFEFRAESNLIERIIHYTVANHFYTVKSEVAMIVRNK